MARIGLLFLISIGCCSALSMMEMIPTTYATALPMCKTLMANEYYAQCLPTYAKTLVSGVCNTKADLTCFVNWGVGFKNKPATIPKNVPAGLTSLKKACPSVFTKTNTAYKALNASIAKCTATAKTWITNMQKDMVIEGADQNAQIANGCCKGAKWYNKLTATDATSKAVKASFTTNFKPPMSCLNLDMLTQLKPMIQMLGTNVASCQSMVSGMMGSLDESAAAMMSSMM